jgi:hypothetical protein
MFKSTPGAHRTVRHIAQDKNAAPGFNGPSDSTYDARAGVGRDVGHSQGTYECNVMGTITQTPKPSKSVKAPIK